MGGSAAIVATSVVQQTSVPFEFAAMLPAGMRPDMRIQGVPIDDLRPSPLANLLMFAVGGVAGYYLSGKIK